MSTTRDPYPSYAFFVDRLSREWPEVAREVSGFIGITAVLTWMQRRGLTRATVDIVGQDEFHYDFLIRADPGRWFSFGVT